MCNGPHVMQRRDRQEKKYNMQSACISCLHSTHTNLSSHTGRHNKQVFYSAAGNAKYIVWKIITIVISHSPHTHDRYNSPIVRHHVHGHYSFLSRSWTLFIPFTSVDTIHSFHVREHYSFLSRPWTLFIPFTSVDTIHSFHFLFSRDRSLNPITSLRTWVSTPPAVSTRLIPQATPA